LVGVGLSKYLELEPDLVYVIRVCEGVGPTWSELVCLSITSSHEFDK
jgi:phage shock protein PspC (stress-responsive transcriptional regulator)